MEPVEWQNGITGVGVVTKSLSPQESVHGDITERRLEVEEREGRKRTVTLLQLSSWSPGELPHPTSILSVVELLNKVQRSSPSRHTTIICRSDIFLSCVFYLPLSIADSQQRETTIPLRNISSYLLTW